MDSVIERVQNHLGDLQDDELIDSLILLIRLHNSIDQAPSLPVSVEHVQQAICPHTMFYFFLQHIEFDHQMAVDWLLSMDTDLLEYLIRYGTTNSRVSILLTIRSRYLHARRNTENASFIDIFGALMSEHAQNPEIAKEIGNLIASRIHDFLRKLHASIQKINQQNLFPYNPTALLRQLEHTMNLL